MNFNDKHRQKTYNIRKKSTYNHTKKSATGGNMNELTLSNNSLITESIAQQWFDFLDVKPKTLETYAKALKQFVLFLNGNDKPQRQDVINFRESIRTTHKPTTCQTYLMAVKQFFKWLSSI